jgi:hypothetical protein
MKAPPPPTTTAVLRIPRDVYEHIREAAKEDRRTISAEIALAIEEWLKARKKKP